MSVIDRMVQINGHIYDRYRSKSRVDDCKKCEYRNYCFSIEDDMSCEEVYRLVEGERHE